jgi:LPS-assembly lipoprotein
MKQAAQIILACAFLSACGFHPLYQSSSSEESHAVAPQLAAVRVDTIPDRQGQILRNELIDRLNPGGEPVDSAYELVVTYSEVQADLGLSNDAVTTRGQLTIAANYRLLDRKTNKVISAASTQAVTAYNIQNSEFATQLSHDDAENRALRQVADDITTALSIYFESPPKPKPDDGHKNPADTGPQGFSGP